MSKGLLALDCSGETFCCGLLVDGKHQTSVVGLSPRRALRELPGHVGYLLGNAELSYSDVEAVGVTVGPGSFTGVRLGVTLAKTIAMTCGCPVAGLDTLQVIAEGFRAALLGGSGSLAVALDARRSEVYCAVFGVLEGKLYPLLPTAVRKPAELAAWLRQARDVKGFIGSGFEAYPELSFPDFEGARLVSRADSAPRAEVLCELTREAVQRGDLWVWSKLQPNYYREADVQVSGGPS